MPEKRITRVEFPARTFSPEQPPPTKRVAAYARVSTMKDAQENSLQAQQEYFTEYIQRHPGWVFAGMYSDDGISGLSIRERDGFNSMVTDALDGKIDLILTKSLSRFARNTVDALTTIRSLKAAGVAVYFQKENINTMDSTGEFLITLIIHPALTMVLAVQPEVLNGLMSNNTFRGRGLTARFLYSMPKSTVGSRSFSTEPIPEGVRVRYRDLIEAILSSDNEQQPISLDDGAEEVLETLFNEVEGRLKGDLAEIPDWAGKFVGSVLRISGILHVMKYPKDSMFDPVDRETMENAVTIGRYFLEHAKAAYSLMGADAVNKNAQYLLSAIRRERLEEFSRRDAMRLCRRFKTAESLQPVLDRLCEYGYLAAKPLPPAHGAGRKPSEVYLTNPAVLEDFAGEGRS